MGKREIILKTLQLFIISSVLFYGSGSPAWTQNIIETDLGSQPASVLVQDLLGSGVSFSNATYQGIGGSAGTFTGGTGIIGFDSGIILSTGLAASVVGPNTGPAVSNTNGVPGDPDLSALASGVTTNDATVLSFDFIPQYDTISFQYVFASDEYNQWVDSFNDVFGFFLNGTNVALIPGTGTNVSINNVNDCTNPAYYIDNIGSPQGGGCASTVPSANLNTSMNGLTTVLTVFAPVVPGVVNHIKLGIADAIDFAVDSNVFIRANSFSSGFTPTFTATPTPSFTPTTTPTPTFTPTWTSTPTVTSTFTISNTPTVTGTPTITFTPTPTFTPTVTYSFTTTYTPTTTYTSTISYTPTITFTPTITLTPTITFTPTCVIQAWPDPYNPAYAWRGLFRIGCLPAGSKVGIYTVSGEEVVQVIQMENDSAQYESWVADWNGRNRFGVRVSSGIYYYVVLSNGQVLDRGKFLVSASP